MVIDEDHGDSRFLKDYPKLPAGKKPLECLMREGEEGRRERERESFFRRAHLLPRQVVARDAQHKNVRVH